MRIAVLGAGNVGQALATALAGKGYDIVLGVRDPNSTKYQDAAKKIGQGASVDSVRGAAESADAALLATPWSAAQAAVEQTAGALDGKILMDCTNPIGPNFTLAIGHSTSGGEMVAAWAKGAHVFKVFNTTGYNIMEEPTIDGRQAAMLVCGDDAEKKLRVLQIVRDVGFDAIDFGKLENARLLEPLALTWIRLAYQQGLGRDFAFALLRR